jgi:glycosyltransferase involved in cell wall biosynthesis/SAM-dependent methyltransferase
MRIALLSPLPPNKSGIADYSAALAEALRPLAPLDVFGGGEGLPDLSTYDAIVYQIGNNGAHDFVYQEALTQPGIVVLHEANLHHLIAEITIKRGDWDGYMRAVEYDGGAEALAYAQAVRRLEVGPDYDGVPMLRRLLRRSRGLIAHSRYVAEIARAQGYDGPVAVIPHGAWLPEPSGAAWRKRLGVEPQQPLLGIFGHLKPYKRIAESLRAFRRLAKHRPDARLILVGEPHPDFPVERLIDSLDLRERVRVIGFAPIEDFVGYLDACDILVNLRYPTVGESSGTMLRALGMGKPVLVSDVGSFAEFPDDVCLKVPVGGPAEEELIFEYLRYLVETPGAARALGANAREWVAAECNWNRVAERYVAFCEEVAGLALPAETAEVIAEPDIEMAVLESDATEDVIRVSGTAESDTGAEPPAVECGAEGSAGLAGELVAADCGTTDGDPEAGDLAETAGPYRGVVEHPLAAELLAWANDEAARQYLMQHLSRLITTLELLPNGAPDRSILEMGCYMQITPALREVKGYGTVRGCYYGKLGDVIRKEARRVDGRRFACDVDAFDAERDRYPYEEGCFDAVLCTELFEHLGHDPMHCLTEIHRILKPGGHLLLSTPNACSVRAIAAILGQYHPGFFPAFMRPNASGEVDPRHHREYAPREVAMAMENAGFTVQTLQTAPYWSTPEPEHAWVHHLLERYELDAGLRDECTFALAVKTGPVQHRYPDWLYYG